MSEKYKDLEDKYKNNWTKGFHGGFSVDDGWYDILKELLDKLDPYFVKGLQLTQIKEKFATLRFYFGYSENNTITKEESDQIQLWVNETESKSAETCERCGAAGKEREGSWLKTLCDNCHKEREVEREKRGY